MDQKYPIMCKAERRQQNVLSFSRHNGIYPQHAKKTQNKQTKKLQNIPQQRNKCCKFFLSPLTVRVIQTSTVQNFIR